MGRRRPPLDAETPMSHPHHDTNDLAGWFFYLLGTFLMFLQDYGLGLLGAASIAVNIYYAVKSDRRKDREHDAKMAYLNRIVG
jgi:hypothetical protein